LSLRVAFEFGPADATFTEPMPSLTVEIRYSDTNNVHKTKSFRCQSSGTRLYWSAPVTRHSSVSILSLRVAFEFGPADATFIEEVLASLPSKNSPLSERELMESASEWDGSDSWIRKHFQVRRTASRTENGRIVHQLVVRGTPM
jgi:hypothetical protein